MYRLCVDVAVVSAVCMVAVCTDCVLMLLLVRNT